MGNVAEEDALSTSYESRPFTLYKRRWFILFILSLLQCSNAMIWISYAPIADLTVTFYHTNIDVVNYIALVYMVVTSVFGFFSAFILDYMGLRAGIIVGAWLNFIGAAIKLLSTFDDALPADSLIIVAFVGQSVAALAQPYLMCATTKLAALWFPEEHRALANTIGSMANPLGIMVGSLLAPGIVKPTSDPDVLAKEFQTLMGVHCGPAGLAAILSVIIITSSKPATPPSASAEEESLSFIGGIKQMLRSKNYWILMICCGAGVALFTALTTVLQQILCPQGYTDSFAGTCSAIMIAVGIVGAAVSGVVADKTKRFEELTKTFYAFAVVSGAAFGVVCRYPDQNALIAITVGAFGFFGFGLFPICLELGVEATYPVAEGTSSAFIIISGQIQSIIYLLVIQSLAVDFNSEYSKCSEGVAVQDFTYSNIFFVVMAFIMSSTLIIFFKADYKRMRAEQEAAAEAILDFNSSSNHSSHSTAN